MAVVVDISISLDGFVTGPDSGVHAGLGERGEALHEWAMASTDPVDRLVLEEATARTGAVVMGRTLFDVVDAPDGWSDSLGYGGRRDQAARPPVFVVTRVEPERVRLVDLFSFRSSLDDALDAALAAAGAKDVVVMGGGMAARGALLSGRADELVLHVAPVVLGRGTPLFEPGMPTVRLEWRETRTSSAAQHLRYRVGTVEEWPTA
ncbi:dihydrofolate reductase family protein [Herbiconiux sp. L3-i23]|uniref:dihydrofolate reductase family protein n=1 Tax=Herbiconiux sp. L3-i23 TaxID=2905871 RepID=UPI002057658A|nr:dihydrofolate reductase family protein [Herbiconiux sp. L3-i23]BDI23365.1 DNA-binding protein [Herbiconiux sp. L3-i23]